MPSPLAIASDHSNHGLLGWLVGGVLLLGLSSSAHAQELGEVVAVPTTGTKGTRGTTIDRYGYSSESKGAPTMVGDIELGTAAEARPDENVAAVSPQIRLGMRPRPEVELHIAFGAVAIVREGPEGRDRDARPSNLSFGASRVFDRRDDRFRYAKVGFSFVIPSALASNEFEQDAYEYALAGRIGWNPWSWMPQTLALVVPAQVRAQVARRWVLGADGGLGALLPSAGRADGLAAAAQVAGEARFVTRRLGLGMRMAAVWNGRHPDDRSQVGVSPFVDASLCRLGSGRRLRGEHARTSEQCPMYALARLNINLDGPYGFTGNESLAAWGVQLGLGWAVY